jgi:hypothetical protein
VVEAVLVGTANCSIVRSLVVNNRSLGKIPVSTESGISALEMCEENAVQPREGLAVPWLYVFGCCVTPVEASATAGGFMQHPFAGPTKRWD